MISATEIAQKIDLGFDYVNLTGFSNEDELKKGHGEEFYKKFVEVFADDRFTLIGEALEFSCVPEIVSNCVKEVAKEFSEIEGGGEKYLIVTGKTKWKTCRKSRATKSCCLMLSILIMIKTIKPLFCKFGEEAIGFFGCLPIIKVEKTGGLQA